MTLPAAQSPINHLVKAEVHLQGTAVRTLAALAFPVPHLRPGFQESEQTFPFLVVDAVWLQPELQFPS